MNDERERASHVSGPGPLWRSVATAWRPGHVGPAWAPWAWTLSLSMLIGTALFVLVGHLSLADSYLTSILIGLSIHALFTLVGRTLRWDMFELSLPFRMLYGVVISLAGATSGFALARLLLTGDPALAWGQIARGGPVMIGMTVFWSVSTYILLAAIARLRRLRAERVAGQLAASEARREADLARLQLLSAQIEPHFLYNTLAHVDALIAARPDAARALLGALIEYLRLSSRNMARETVSLDEELGSVRGYIAVMRYRMGDRLQVLEELEPGTGSVRLPPASLQTLVENAIKHGLEPMPRGGQLRLSACMRDGRYEIAVADNGAGLGAAPAADAGAGIGLENLRERLRLCHGGRARLSLSSSAQGATIAMIRIEPEQTAR